LLTREIFAPGIDSRCIANEDLQFKREKRLPIRCFASSGRQRIDREPEITTFIYAFVAVGLLFSISQAVCPMPFSRIVERGERAF
jgi:hypothetical protein